MSLNLTRNKARLTVFGYGWDDEVVDSGDANTDEGAALEEYVENNTDYEFPDDFDWDAVAEDMGVELDDDGNITDTDTLDDNLYDLANDPDAIIDYMTDTSESIIPPARIVILNPPDVTEYTDGDTIDYTGIIVAAFTSLTTMTPFINSALEGEVNNLIPFNQLTFPVTTADISSGAICTNGNGCNAMLISYTAASVPGYPGNTAYLYQGTLGTHHGYPVTLGGHSEGVASLYVTRYNGLVYACRISGNGYFDMYDYRDGTWHFSGGSGYRTTIGRFTVGSWEEYLTGIPESTVNPATVDPDSLTVSYVSIPVQWQTEYQTDPFEDTFDITVTEAED